MTDAQAEGTGTIGVAALGWWKQIQEDSGARAELRRCRTPAEAARCPAAHDLYAALKAAGCASREVAMWTAIVLAHVRGHDPRRTTAAHMVGADPRSPVVSALRFRRLLRCNRREALVPLLRRAVSLTDGVAHVVDLAESVVFWGDSRQKQWAFEYFERVRNSRPEQGGNRKHERVHTNSSTDVIRTVKLEQG